MFDFFPDPTIAYTLLGVLGVLFIVTGLVIWRRISKRHKTTETKKQDSTSKNLTGTKHLKQAADTDKSEQPTGGLPTQTLEDQDEHAQIKDETFEIEQEKHGSNGKEEQEEDIQIPQNVQSRMVRLRSRLAGSGAIGKTVLSVLSRKDLRETDWEEIEDTLLLADLGIDPTDELMKSLRTSQQIAGTTNVSEIRDILRKELLSLVDPALDRELKLKGQTDPQTGKQLPGVVLMVGVNGSGKTTTVGKLARLLVAQKMSVILGAADTFRAAAAEQLQTWGRRVGVETVRSEQENADPASVAFEAIKVGKQKEIDVVLVDTAGRLQNKTGLMDELEKIRRVIEKQAPITESLLVLDATTGQNALSQAKVFAKVAGVTGIVLTKLDGSAKGGIVIAVQRELGVPVKLVGLGEGPDDLAPFDPENFVDAIVSDQ